MSMSPLFFLAAASLLAPTTQALFLRLREEDLQLFADARIPDCLPNPATGKASTCGLTGFFNLRVGNPKVDHPVFGEFRAVRDAEGSGGLDTQSVLRLAMAQEFRIRQFAPELIVGDGGDAGPASAALVTALHQPRMYTLQISGQPTRTNTLGKSPTFREEVISINGRSRADGEAEDAKQEDSPPVDAAAAVDLLFAQIPEGHLALGGYKHGYLQQNGDCLSMNEFFLEAARQEAPTLGVTGGGHAVLLFRGVGPYRKQYAVLEMKSDNLEFGVEAGFVDVIVGRDKVIKFFATSTTGDSLETYTQEMNVVVGSLKVARTLSDGEEWKADDEGYKAVGADVEKLALRERDENAFRKMLGLVVVKPAVRERGLRRGFLG